MEYIQTFLKKFNRISFRETPKVLSLAGENFFEIQHAQLEDKQELLNKLLQDLQSINEELAEYISSLSWNRSAFYDDDDDDQYTIRYRGYLENSSNAITPVLPIEEPDNFLSTGDEHLSTISETKSDKVTKSSVEDLVPILRKSVTFSNPLFDSNDDFTSSDNESLSDEDVPEDVKIYSNPLFEFDDGYISSDVNPLFDEVLEDIECKDSYDSNLDESTFLVTPLSDSNKDECFTPSVDVELLLHHDPSLSVVSILEGFTDEPPLEENDDLFDLESKENDWKKILYDAPINDLISEDKVFNPGIHEIYFSPTYASLPFEDHNYFSFTYVIRTFLPYFTYPVESPFLLSSRSEDTIFEPDISVFHFSSLKPAASHQSGTFICVNVYPNILNEIPMEICSSTCFIPNITMIWGESS
ncbi:hypothetical protein Tco_0721953 [Tanacetum coccineum]